MRTLEQIKQEIQSLESKNFKTKKARENNWSKIRSLKHEAYPILEKIRNELQSQYSEKQELTITHVGSNWSCARNEDLMGEINPANDVNSASWYTETCCIEYIKGQKIKANVVFEIDLDQFKIEYFFENIEGGILNREKYIALKDGDRKLAFFKYNLLDGDNSISGLFA